MQRADDIRPYRENWSACNGGDMSPPYGWEYGGVVQWIARVEMQVRVLPPPRMGLLLDGSRRMRFGAALGIRAGENPAAYGGVV